MKTAVIILGALVCFPLLNATGQKMMTIKGTVTAFNIYPLNNVIVKSMKTKASVLTDALGCFIIECTEDDILEASAAGFNKKRIRVKNSNPIKIDLSYQYMETSFEEAVNHNHINRDILNQAVSEHPYSRQKDYSRYQNIYELIQNEFNTLRVVGTSVYNAKANSFSLSAQVLYVVDNMVVSDISFVSPVEVKKIEFFEDSEASTYGMRGGNGVIRITLRKE